MARQRKSLANEARDLYLKSRDEQLAKTTAADKTYLDYLGRSFEALSMEERLQWFRSAELTAIRELQEENDKLRAALTHYAKPDNWVPTNVDGATRLLVDRLDKINGYDLAAETLEKLNGRS